jgi:hypothetical protein
VNEKRSQELEDVDDGVWSSVWTTRRDYSEDTLQPETAQRDSTAPNLALAPDPDPDTGHRVYAAPLKVAHSEPCTDLAQAAIKAAKASDLAADWSTAIQHYTVAVEHGSSDPQVYFRLGVLLRLTNGDLRLSLAHLRTASHLRPEQIVYRRELAEVYEALGFPINARSQRERIGELQETAPTKRSWWFW